MSKTQSPNDWIRSKLEKYLLDGLESLSHFARRVGSNRQTITNFVKGKPVHESTINKVLDGLRMPYSRPQKRKGPRFGRLHRKIRKAR